MYRVANTDAGQRAANWKFIYIAEAHAMDEWPVTSGRFNRGRGPVIIEKQPRTATHRCELARNFARAFDLEFGRSNSIELLVDDPERGDLFEKEYAPWPIRLFLIDGSGKMEWIAQPKDSSYDLAVEELVKLLNLDD